MSKPYDTSFSAVLDGAFLVAGSGGVQDHLTGVNPGSVRGSRTATRAPPFLGWASVSCHK